MRVVLEVVEGASAGQRCEQVGPGSILVGRSPEARLRLDPLADLRTSRAHFLVEVWPDRCLVIDLDSANGTFVNGERISRQGLADGDEIRVGHTRIRARLLGDPGSEDGAKPAVPSGVPEPGEGRAIDATGGDSPGTFCCAGCGLDLTPLAASDGLGESLPDASYLCRTCALAQQSLALAGRWLGEFALLQHQGRGGMGVVYKAIHGPTRRVCAVKHLHASVAVDERARRTFEREIDVQSAVRHPNLARVLGRGEAAGCFFVAMEFLPGGDAGQLVGRTFGGPLPPTLACRLALQVLAGLEALHGAGFVHRDLKPANFLLSRPYPDPAAVAKITDYGLAKSFTDAGNSVYNYTLAGEAGGSLLFMPPEQIRNFRFVTPAADLYAVGVSLYFLLTARHTVDFPEPGGAAAARRTCSPIDLVLEEPPIPVLRRNPDLPPALAEVVDRAVQKDLGARFATATALREALLAVAPAAATG